MSAAKEATSRKTWRVYQSNIEPKLYNKTMSGGSFLAMKGISSVDIINPSMKQIAKQNPLWNNSETGSVVRTLVFTPVSLTQNAISASTALFSPLWSKI